MAYEHDEGTGSLFRNERKETEKHPDYNGSCKIGGVEYWIAAWINTSRANPNKKFLGIRFNEKDNGFENQKPASRPADGAASDFDDDIPF